MAIIGKIREKSTLLIVVIGLAMAAFILGDLFRGGPTGDESTFAVVWGEPLDQDDYREYQEMEQRMVEDAIGRARQQGATPSPMQLKQARDNAWNSYIREKVLNNQIDLLGIEVTPEELTEIVHGRYVDQFIRDMPIFQDTIIDSMTRQPKQVFNPALVTQFINNLEQLPEEQYNQWLRIEQFLKENRAYRKYFALIRHGLYATTAEARAEYMAVNKQKKIRFVVKKFSEGGFTDEELGLTSEEKWDEMVYEYYKDHKDDKQYEQPGSRVFEYVAFDIDLSDIDKQKAKELIASRIKGLQTTTNDSSYTTIRSDSREWTGNRMTSVAQLPQEARKMISEADSGDVVGPYEQDGYYKVAKVLEKSVDESKRSAKHLLVAYEGATRSQATRSKEEAKRIADSLWAIFQYDTTGWHAAVASDVSNNSPGTKNKDGDLGYFGEGMMATEFNDFVFNNPVGSWGLVETDFGYHIINVTDAGETQARLAIMDKKIQPTTETKKKFEREAIEFVSEAYQVADNNELGSEAFHELAQKYQLPIDSKEVMAEAPSIPGFEQNSMLLRWLRGAMVGNLSDPIIIGDQIIVARVHKIKKKGTPDFEDVKDRMRVPAKNELMADTWVEKAKGYNSLEEAAAALGTSILEANVTFDNLTIAGGGGQEPRVVGAVFSNVEDGYLFPEAMKGKYGVYVVEVVQTIEPNMPEDFTAQRQKLHDELRGYNSSTKDQVDYDIYEAIKEKAGVEDKRDSF